MDQNDKKQTVCDSTIRTVDQQEPSLDLVALETELAGFTGTEHHYRSLLGLRYTDGVKHLAERARAYWLIDAIASWQPKVRKIDADFQLWELIVEPTNRAVLTCRRDANALAQIWQDIDYTDFPVGRIKLYVERGVLLLPSEH